MNSRSLWVIICHGQVILFNKRLNLFRQNFVCIVSIYKNVVHGHLFEKVQLLDQFWVFKSEDNFGEKTVLRFLSKLDILPFWITRRELYQVRLCENLLISGNSGSRSNYQDLKVGWNVFNKIMNYGLSRHEKIIEIKIREIWISN